MLMKHKTCVSMCKKLVCTTGHPCQLFFAVGLQYTVYSNKTKPPTFVEDTQWLAKDIEKTLLLGA